MIMDPVVTKVYTYNEAGLRPGEEGDGGAVHQQVCPDAPVNQLTENKTNYNGLCINVRKGGPRSPLQANFQPIGQGILEIKE